MWDLKVSSCEGVTVKSLLVITISSSLLTQVWECDVGVGSTYKTQAPVVELVL